MKWKELLGFGALVFLGSELDRTSQENAQLEDEKEELRSQLAEFEMEKDERMEGYDEAEYT